MDKVMKDVVALVGAGGIGVAIARRVAQGKHLVLTSRTQEEVDRVAADLQRDGFDCSAMACDLGSREDILAVIAHCQQFGPITNVICAGGVSPSQAPIAEILRVDLYGTSVLLEEFGKVIAQGGSGVVVSSQSGHRLPALSAEENWALAMTPTEELLNLPLLAEDSVGTTLRAYQYAKRCNVLRVQSQACEWGRRGARVFSISPGIIMTPLAFDELNGPRGEGYRKMLDLMPAKRAGTVDEMGALVAFLMGPEGTFITGTDILCDGGSTAAYWYGDLQYLQEGWSQS
ncbi:short chain dehydrogenase [Propionibacterium ruminifibrarum]|uniref:Short chain dehydrogenase n=1 Tax=Propionibacterium ruminifibrarum TaxID=1962131 RepID=A0A375I424_9ACTN|nr:SDR family oxidoreductase [Propionibacterium ruminifibrarum]SPF68884.1 short chain dehydrogenase [Propionibacterium ruminifibrarum]